eukprot:jgi/Mesvir1/1511/Mv14494-RA.1
MAHASHQIPAFYFQYKRLTPDEAFFPCVDTTVDSPFQYFTPTAERITHIRATPADGSCFFHALCLQMAARDGKTLFMDDLMKMSWSLRRKVRQASPAFVADLSATARQELEETLEDKAWADQSTVWVTAKYLQTDIYIVGVHYEDRRPYFVWMKTACGLPRGGPRKPHIIFWNGVDHFSCLLSESDIRNGGRVARRCQGNALERSASF